MRSARPTVLSVGRSVGQWDKEYNKSGGRAEHG